MINIISYGKIMKVARIKNMYARKIKIVKKIKDKNDFNIKLCQENKRLLNMN